MEDIELVIKINKHIANAIIAGKNDEPISVVRGFQATIADAIRTGTPLPKGHGDLIDSNALQKEMGKDVRKAMSFVDLTDFVQLAPPIIKADKENVIEDDT